MLRHALAVDTNGRIVGDPLIGFVVTDGPTTAEASDDVLYYLAVGPNGSWAIRKRTISAGTERFAFGYGDASEAFLNKASQTYDRAYVVL